MKKPQSQGSRAATERKEVGGGKEAEKPPPVQDSVIEFILKYGAVGPVRIVGLLFTGVDWGIRKGDVGLADMKRFVVPFFPQPQAKRRKLIKESCSILRMIIPFLGCWRRRCVLGQYHWPWPLRQNSFQRLFSLLRIRGVKNITNSFLFLVTLSFFKQPP